jgi:hypothetical protein
VVGADSIELYLAEASSGDRDVSFEVRDTAVSRDGSDYYVRWEMELVSPGLNGGQPVRTAGSSHLRFDADGRIILHRDFWDTAEGFYERIPVLGWLIGRVRDRV